MITTHIYSAFTLCQELYIHLKKIDSSSHPPPPPNKEAEVHIMQLLKRETFKLREVQ